MAPKKRKHSPRKEKEPELVEEWLDKDLDLIKDLDDDFFQTYNLRIQYLMQNGRITEATHMKRTVDLLYNLHHKYVLEVKDNNELKPKISRANEMLRLALEITGNSQEAMDNLKKHLEGAWMESDFAQLRELSVQKEFQELMVKCESEQKETYEDGEGGGLGSMTKYRNVIMRERDRLNAEVMDMEKRIQMLRYYSEGLEDINRDLEETKTKVNLRLKAVTAEKSAIELKNKALALTLEDQRAFSAKTLNKLNATTKELTTVYAKFNDTASSFDKQRLKIDKMQNEIGGLMRTVKKNELELAENLATKRDMDNQIKELRTDNKAKDGQLSEMTKRLKKTELDLKTMSSKLLKSDRLHVAMNEELAFKKNTITNLEKQLTNAAQHHNELQHLKDHIARERDTCRSDVVKLNNLIADLRRKVALNENKIGELNQDMQKLNAKLEEERFNLRKAEKDRDDMAQEKEAMREKVADLQDDLSLKTSQIRKLTDDMDSMNATLMETRKNLESSHSEKVLLQKNLDAVSQERDNLRFRQTQSSYQMIQLSNEINQNQKKISTMSLHIDHMNKAKKDMENTLKNTETVLAGVRNDLKLMKSKNHDLMNTVEYDEKRFIKLTYELNNAITEKNLTGQQMVRRNDEIVVLRDKLHMAQSAVDLGQQQYNQRVEDISLLKCEIKNLRSERECLTRAIKSTADMRLELTRVHTALNQERVKVRALTEDIRTPATVHRWRILKGAEPSKYQLIMKCNTLQRRNLKHELDKANLNKKLEESRQVCANLKNMLENMPPPDVKTKLAECQRIARVREKKLKILSAELSVNEIEMKARDCIIEEYQLSLQAAQQMLTVEPEELDCGP